MPQKQLPRLSLAQKFYLTLVLPLLVTSMAVTWMTYRGLEHNAAELEEVLKIQAKTNKILSLLLTQDDASKALLIDPSQLEFFSGKKIAAYDEHKNLLADLRTSVSQPEIREIIVALSEFDEQRLRPLDTKILELLFEDPAQAGALYFKEYEPNRIVYEENIRKLARLGDELVRSEATAMARKNHLSLLQIGLALVLGIVIVAATITILSRQVERAEDNRKSLLAVLNEGLFFFDRQGRIALERSQALIRIIPGSEQLGTMQELVSRHAKIPPENVKTCLDLLWSDGTDGFMSDFDSTVTLLPRALRLDGERTVHLEYRPLNGPDGKLDKVVVVAVDVTERLKTEAEAIKQAERVRKMARVSSGPESYLSFAAEATALFQRADRSITAGESSTAGMLQLKRDLHTLKGSVGTFDFTGLAEDLHELETLLEELPVSSPRIAQRWREIHERWRVETNDIATVLGLAERQGGVFLPRPKWQRLLDWAQAHGDTRLAGLLADCQRVPLKATFEKYSSYLQRLTERRGDKRVELVVTETSAEVSHEEVQPLDAAIVHLLRNCLDHGLEETEQRRKAGKTEVGRITVDFQRAADGSRHLVIEDDGQGIDAEKLAAKAVASGLWTAERARRATFQDKVELIFAPNLSTKDTVSDISGRGVGMDAVKALLGELGGGIAVKTTPGYGTRFELMIPSSKALAA